MDYDVEVLGLKTPASTAPLSTSRLVVSVRNNGIHNAVAAGYVRVYSTSLLVFESEVYSDTLTPGATGDASSVDYWTPPAEGLYMIQGYLSCPLDQDEPNNNLNPTTIRITGAPPTPPTPVELHASQHEEGGRDELSIEGLPGRAADPQDAAAHAAQHQAGGTDALNVGSLQGILAQDQPAQAHSNARHNPAMATSAELTSHQTAIAAHPLAENLANRDLSGAFTGLVPSAQLALGTTDGAGPRFLSSGRFFDSPIPIGLICLWSDLDPNPPGWINVILPPPSLSYHYIVYQPVTGGV